MTDHPPRHPRHRWTTAISLALLHLLVAGACFAFPLLDGRWLPLLVVGPFLLAPLESLLLTPLYALTGRFRYYSPLLLATRRAGGGLDLHVGTLHDYATRFRWRDRGRRAARAVSVELLRGLLALADEVERGALPAESELVGTSYFFSDRTAARLGFELRRPPGSSQLNLMVASLSIALRLSFTRGRPAFPRLSRIRRAVTTGARLLERRREIESILRRLEADPALPV